MPGVRCYPHKQHNFNALTERYWRFYYCTEYCLQWSGLEVNVEHIHLDAKRDEVWLLKPCF
jgi:hypothetical protein